MSADKLSELQAEGFESVRDLLAAYKRLQYVIDSRPAINMGLPGSYVEWSQNIYAMQFSHSREVMQ
jgi:hypothetical protein